MNKQMYLLLRTASSKAVAAVVTNHQTQSSVDGIYKSRPMSYASGIGSTLIIEVGIGVPH
ncbi:MAG: hypothetical protein WA364_27035 [Candidatus Nitrosopolaris sp.]